MLRFRKDRQWVLFQDEKGGLMNAFVGVQNGS